MNAILSVTIASFAVSWLVITVLSHIHGMRRFVRVITRYDICAAVPSWTFFAPNPGRSDLYLLYRDRDSQGHITPWREIVLERRLGWWHLWNPRRRIGKGIVDIASDLTLGTNYQPQASVDKKKVVSFPYLLLLNYACQQPTDFRAERRQFAVARTEGHGTESRPEVTFLSAFHRLN